MQVSNRCTRLRSLDCGSCDLIRRNRNARVAAKRIPGTCNGACYGNFEIHYVTPNFLLLSK